nr:MATE family efflux transporter [uncultured Clostridium sp.]
MQRDAIDFEKENTGVLFRRMLIPTLISSVFSMVMTISDGIFVGHGIGSSALAAVNIVAPLWLIGSGIGLMFGMGASVVASIHLAKNKLKAARINLTQSILFHHSFWQ